MTKYFLSVGYLFDKITVILEFMFHPPSKFQGYKYFEIYAKIRNRLMKFSVFYSKLIRAFLNLLLF